MLDTEHFYGNSLNAMLLAMKCELFQSQICEFIVCLLKIWFLKKLELLLIMLSLPLYGIMGSSNYWVMAIKMRVLTKCCLKCSCGDTGESLRGRHRSWDHPNTYFSFLSPMASRWALVLPYHIFTLNYCSLRSHGYLSWESHEGTRSPCLKYLIVHNLCTLLSESKVLGNHAA